MTRLSTRSPWMDFATVLGNREPFKTWGAFYAETYEGTSPSYRKLGRLDSEYRTSFYECDYAVYSYNTPIAWHGADGWHMPDEKYSVTTSSHQSKIFFVKDWAEMGIA